MIALISQGISLGFTAGNSPGPLQSFLISTTLSRGWQQALVIILSPLLTDAPIILLMTFVLTQLPASALDVVRVVGGVFVLWLAWNTWRSIRAGEGIRGDENAPVVNRRSLLWRAMTVNYLSPGPYIFWFTVNGPLLREALDQSLWHGLAFLVSFYGAFMLVMAAWVLAFDRLRRVDPRVTQAALTLTLVVLAGLGFVLIGQGIGVL